MKQFEEIIGKTEEEARKIVESKRYDSEGNYIMRVVSVNGEATIGTCDFRLDRLNVRIQDGLVSEIYSIG